MIGVTILFDGHWSSSNAYIEENAAGILMPEDCTMKELNKLICNALEVDADKYSVSIKYRLAENGAFLRINNDLSLQFYLEAKRLEKSFSRYPLFVDYQMLDQEDQAGADENVVHLPAVVHRLVPPPISNPVLPLFPSRDELGNELYEQVRTSLHTCEFQLPDIVDEIDGVSVRIGQCYRNKEVLKLSISHNAILNGYQFYTYKSDKGEYHVKCLAEVCKWSLRATRMPNTTVFKIQKINGIHECSADNLTLTHKNATHEFGAHCIKYKFVNSRTIYTPADIIMDMQQNYMVKLTYDKARRAREYALKLIRGDPAESYQILPSYLHMVQYTNPGTVTRIKTDAANRFLYCFVALGASIRGWPHCRPVIVIDATYLNGIYGGTLFTACTQDANDHIFILAYGVGDGETIESWGWFLQKLRESFGERDNLCIVSDRHRSIASVAEGVFPTATHVACSYHLLNNAKKKYGNKSKGITAHFNAAARSYTLDDFNLHMSHIGKISEEVLTYLEEAGYDRWSRAHMIVNRYSTMTSNIVESVNSVTRTAKNYPIEALFECMRTIVQRWFNKHNEKTRGTFTPLCSKHEKTLKLNISRARRYQVLPIDETNYQIINGTSVYTICLEDRTCTCRRFQIDELPCAHAIAAIWHTHQSIYDYCSNYFKKTTNMIIYSGTVFPVGDRTEWDVPTDIQDMIVLPPVGRRGPGRPKESRYKSSTERKKTQKCSRCHAYGHNSRKCRSPNPLIALPPHNRKRKTRGQELPACPGVAASSLILQNL